MFPYHNRLKQLLKTKEYYVIKEDGKFAYRFVFPSENKSIPIREYRVSEYLEYIPKELFAQGECQNQTNKKPAKH